MYLSKLELHGFKSFADRTIVDFSPGVTAVVGPNGCGKSNIVDAVRWVIGEQRARILRSDKMDDVIFNGTRNRRSLGMSEVLLTIENTHGVLPIEYSEVTIGRRLFRSGESEYLLNGVQCRLKDITDLFMDTGMGAGAYSVIELKMIEDILSDSADDRRHMFDEAAGISKYKTRRGQSLRKLASTQTSLNRVRDLADELEKRVRSLERQARKASRFKRLDDRLNYLVLALAVTEYAALSQEATALHRLISDSALENARLTAELATHEASHESLRKDHIEKEQSVIRAQTQLSDHLEMLRQAESDLRLNQERIASIERDLNRASRDQEDADARISTLVAELTTARSARDDAVPAVKEHSILLEKARLEKNEAERDFAESRGRVNQLISEERRVESELVEKRRLIDRLGNQVELCDQDLERHADEFARIEKLVDGLNDRQKDTDRSSIELELAHTKRLQELETAHALLESRSENLRASEMSKEGLERRAAAVRAEMAVLKSLFSSYDDLSESVQYLATSSDWAETELRTVADLFACDEPYRVALDTALGDFSSCIVVQSEKEAARAILNLKTDEKGRATFLVADRLSKTPETRQGREIRTLACQARPLSSLVRVSEVNCKDLADHLLYDCFLVDEIESVEKAGPSSGRYFTVEGEWYDAAGFRHGGSPATGTSPAAGRLGRREQFDRLQIEIQEIEVEIDKWGKRIKEAQTSIDEIPIDELERVVARSTQQLVEFEKLIGQADFEVSTLLQRTGELTSHKSEISKKKTTTVEQIESLQEKINSLEKAFDTVHAQRIESESVIETLEKKDRKANAEFNEINIASIQARTHLEHVSRECSRIDSDLKRLESEKVRRKEHVAGLRAELNETKDNSTSLEGELGKLRTDRSQLDKNSSASKDLLAEVKVALSDNEARLRVVRRDREESISIESRHSVRQAEIDTRLIDLVETVSEDYEIDIKDYSMEIDAEFESVSARTEIRELRSRIRNLGPVNALALESFEDEKTRLDFLKTQLGDLEQAENALLATIREINVTASARFNETFGRIQANFIRLFVELFGEEAAASVSLVNPGDPLESPIEIMARPRGKKLSVLAQLSGGEKTLTAIALLFAIYLVKPSPFCILDEVDAPLDDANVDRFMHMIRTFSNSTQFILVTHNKSTMEAADCMYGVTMAEQGVSRLVGVQFDSEPALVV